MGLREKKETVMEEIQDEAEMLVKKHFGAKLGQRLSSEDMKS